MTAYTGCLDWVMPDVPMAPVPLVVNAIRDAVIELCERALVYRQELPQILVLGPTSTTTTAASPASISHLSLPGTSGSNVSTPNAAPIQILGDIQIIACITPDDSTPAAISTIVSKWSTVADQRAYKFYLDTTGKLGVVTSFNGISDTALKLSSSAPTFVAGVPLWVKVAVDVNIGGSTRGYSFYTSTDPATTDPADVTWAQIGSQTTSFGAVTIFNSSAPLEIGSNTGGTVEPFAGSVYHVSVYNGIGGTLVADFDPNDAAAGATTFPSVETGEVYTLNGSATITTSSTLTLADVTNFTAGSLLLVDLSDGTQWRGTQSGAPSGYTITLSEPMNLDVLSGATVTKVVSQYTITPPTGFAMAKGLQAWLNNSPIDPISPDDLDNEFNNTSFGWVGVNWRTDVNLPTRFHFPDDNTVALTMPPSTGGVGSLRINAALKPTRASTTFPTALFERYIDTIAHGAKAKLMLVPTKPYTNKELGAYHEGMFIAGIGEARIRMARGATRAPLRSHTVFGLR